MSGVMFEVKTGKQKQGFVNILVKQLQLLTTNWTNLRPFWLTLENYFIHFWIKLTIIPFSDNNTWEKPVALLIKEILFLSNQFLLKLNLVAKLFELWNLYIILIYICFHCLDEGFKGFHIILELFTANFY